MKIDYNENVYTLTFNIYNVEKFINMNLLYLFFEVNKNIINNKIIDDNNNGFFLITHLFKDIGIKQKYLKLNMNHDIKNNRFEITTQNNLNFDIPNNTEILNINIFIDYKKINGLNYDFCVSIENIIENNDIEENIQHFKLDKIIGKFIIKLFNNLKEYIEGNIC